MPPHGGCRQLEVQRDWSSHWRGSPDRVRADSVQYWWVCFNSVSNSVSSGTLLLCLPRGALQGGKPAGNCGGTCEKAGRERASLWAFVSFGGYPLASCTFETILSRTRAPAMLMTAPALLEERACLNCRTFSGVVEDSANGEAICRGCGLVVRRRLTIDAPEWRIGSASDGKPSGARAGPSIGGLGYGAGGTRVATAITDDGSARASTLSKTQAAVHGVVGSTRTGLPGATSVESLARPWSRIGAAKLAKAGSRIERICERSGLSSSTVARSEALLQTALTRKLRLPRSKTSEAALAAASVYAACRIAGIPRTMKEAAVASGVTKRDLGRAFIALCKVVPEAKGTGGEGTGAVISADTRAAFSDAAAAISEMGTPVPQHPATRRSADVLCFLRRYASDARVSSATCRMALGIAEEVAAGTSLNGRSAPVAAAAALALALIRADQVPASDAAAVVASISSLEPTNLTHATRELEAAVDLSEQARRPRSAAATGESKV